MKRLFFDVILALLICSISTFGLRVQPAMAPPSTITVPDDYPTIQAAINAANPEDTVYVRAGIYCENVVVNKTLSLVGENSQNTTIDGGGLKDVVVIVADRVNITGFTTCNSAYNPSSAGIRLEIRHSYCTIAGNSIVNNGVGVYLRPGGSNNTIVGNNIANSSYGFFDLFSSNNTVVENSIASNGLGVWLRSSSNNLFYHNNFIGNYRQVDTGGLANSWDDGYPSGGNYWSDYSGVDLYNGSCQNETGSDGIGDTPYVIDAVNVDHYPFMGLSGQQSVRQLAVPFFYQEKDYYCGPACLKMVFSYYGERISQAEIANVARTSLEYDGTASDELLRAGHFSNQSTSMGEETPQNITGYTLRKLGYAAFEYQGMSLAQLESCLDKGEPLILTMWYSYHHVSTHYRVATGYNQTHVFVHDPWNEPAWGGAYGGPDTAFNVTYFMDLWSYSNDYALYVAPWEISISAPAYVTFGITFFINATVVYPQPLPNAFSEYPAGFCDASITLPANLSLAEGEVQKKTIGTGSLYAGGNCTVTWAVVANSSVTGTIGITAQGWISGDVGSWHNYPSYSYYDRIGATANTLVTINDKNVGSIGGIRGGGGIPYMK